MKPQKKPQKKPSVRADNSVSKTTKKSVQEIRRVKTAQPFKNNRKTLRGNRIKCGTLGKFRTCQDFDNDSGDPRFDTCEYLPPQEVQFQIFDDDKCEYCGKSKDEQLVIPRGRDGSGTRRVHFHPDLETCLHKRFEPPERGITFKLKSILKKPEPVQEEVQETGLTANSFFNYTDLWDDGIGSVEMQMLFDQDPDFLQKEMAEYDDGMQLDCSDNAAYDLVPVEEIVYGTNPPILRAYRRRVNVVNKVVSVISPTSSATSSFKDDLADRDSKSSYDLSTQGSFSPRRQRETS